MQSEPRDAPNRDAADCGPRGSRPELIMVGSCLLWAACFVGAMHLIKNNHVAGPLAWLVAAATSAASLWMLLAYARYLRGKDELERQIQLQAVAWAFGGWFFAMSSYLLLEPLGAPAIDTATVMALMPILFALGTLVGRWRYR